MANCQICGRTLKDWRTCAPDDPACDCGGDCRACMDEVEGLTAPPTDGTVDVGTNGPAGPEQETV